MNNLLKSLMVGSLLLILSIPSYGADIVIDPGHNGFEQNRGGGAFTVDFVGDQLTTVEDTGSIMIEVNDASNFSSDTEYDTIKIGSETKNIQNVNYSSNIITLSSGLSEQHSAGEPVRVLDFLVQSMGRKFDGTDPDSWAGSDTNFDELSYTHIVSADEWDSWARKTEVDGSRLGLLEVLNTWEVATRLRDKLDTGLGHTVTMTKSQALETVSFEDRAGTVAKPDIFISIHTNASPDSTNKGSVYVPYKTHPYDQDYGGASPSIDPASRVWSPSHGFNVDWFVGSDTSNFDTPVSTIQDTPILLVNHDYHNRTKDKDANPVDPFTLRHQIFDSDDDTTVIGSTLSDTVDGLGPLQPGRQSRGKAYSNAFTFSETGPFKTNLRGPFQGDQQDTLGLDTVDALDDVVANNRAEPDVNCKSGGNCDLALGSWLGDIRDGHDPAFTLSEVAFHTSPDNAEWLINNCDSSCGFDTAAEKIAGVLDPYSPVSQDEKFQTGKETNRPHPFEVRTLTMQGKVRNQQTGALLGSHFNLQLTEISSGGGPVTSLPTSWFASPAMAAGSSSSGTANDFSGTGPGNTMGILISDFDTGTYSGTVAQVGGSGGSALFQINQTLSLIFLLVFPISDRSRLIRFLL